MGGHIDPRLAVLIVPIRSRLRQALRGGCDEYLLRPVTVMAKARDARFTEVRFIVIPLHGQRRDQRDAQLLRSVCAEQIPFLGKAVEHQDPGVGAQVSKLFQFIFYCCVQRRMVLRADGPMACDTDDNGDGTICRHVSILLFRSQSHRAARPDCGGPAPCYGRS